MAMELLDYMRPIIDWVHNNPGWSGLVVFLISLWESLAIIGLLIPGTMVMTAIGALVGAGVLPAYAIIIWAILGAIAGDSISYRIGYFFKDHIIDFWPFSRYQWLLEKGEQFFVAHGGKSVFIGRFVGPVRPIIPVIAGMMKMRPRNFIIYNIISAVLWAPCYMLPGILLGALSQELDPKTASHFLIILVVGLVFISLTAWLFKVMLSYLLKKLDKVLTATWLYMKSHPRYRFLCQALKDPRTPHGHGQLTLALLFILFLSGFIGLTIWVQYYNGLEQFNLATHTFFRSFRTPLLNSIFISITLFGFSVVLLCAHFVTLLYLCWKKHWRSAIHLFILVGLTVFTIESLKLLIASPRPNGLANLIAEYSYPSGHTTFSVVSYGFWAVLISRDLNRYLAHVIYSLASVVCGLIIVSRMYLGAHWFTDIIAGILLGLAIVSLITISYRRCPTTVISSWKTGIVILLGLGIAWTIEISTSLNRFAQKYEPEWPTY